MADQEERARIVLDADIAQMERNLAEGQDAWQAFVDLVTFGMRSIIKEGKHLGAAMANIGKVVAAPFEQISKSTRKWAAITAGMMGFAAESAQKYYSQVRVLQTVVEHTNHELEKQAHTLEMMGQSTDAVRGKIVDFSTVMKEAREVGRKFNLSQKDVMVGFSNLAGVLPNNNKQWEKFIGLAKFAAIHHPNYGDLTTQIANLSNAIATGNTQMIRHIAGNLTLSQVYKERAIQLNKTVAQMSQMEKAEATLAALQRQVGDVSKVASADLNTQVSIGVELGRMWNALGRMVFPFWNALKKMVLTVIRPISEALEDAADAIDEARNAIDTSGPAWKQMKSWMGEAISNIVLLIQWLIKLTVSIVIKPLVWFAKALVSVSGAATVASGAISGVFAIVGQAISTGAVVAVANYLFQIAKAFLTAAKAATNFKGALQGAWGIMKATGKAVTATEGFASFEALTGGIKGTAQGTKAQKFASRMWGSLKGAFKAVVKGEAVIDSSKIINEAAIAGRFKRLRTIFQGAFEPLAAAAAKFSNPLRGLIDATGKMAREGGILAKILNFVVRRLTTAFRWTEQFTLAIYRLIAGFTGASKASEKFVTLAARSGRIAAFFGKIGEFLGRIVFGFKAAAGGVAATAGKMASFGSKAMILLKTLGRVLLVLGFIMDIITIGRAIVIFGKWRAAVKEAREEMERMAKVTAENYGKALDTTRGGLDELDKKMDAAFEERGIAGLQDVSKELQKQIIALVSIRNHTADTARADKDIQRIIKLRAVAEARIDAARKSIHKNTLATARVLAVDNKMNQEAVRLQKDISKLLEKRKRHEGAKESDEYKEANKQLQSIADSLGIDIGLLERMATGAKGLNQITDQLWKTQGVAILKEMNAQWKQAKDRVTDLAQTIIDARTEAERFVQSFQLGGMDISNASKARSELELLMDQFERAKEAGVEPGKLAEMSKEILAGMSKLGEARMAAFEKTPRGRAFKMQVDAMMRADPGAAERMMRQQRLVFENAARNEFGAEALLEDYKMFSEEALKDEKNELERARDTLKQIQQDAGVFYKTLLAAGKAAPELADALRDYPEILNEAIVAAEKLNQLTGDAAANLAASLNELRTGTRVSTRRLGEEEFQGRVAGVEKEASELGGASITEQIADLQSQIEARMARIEDLEGQKKVFSFDDEVDNQIAAQTTVLEELNRKLTELIEEQRASGEKLDEEKSILKSIDDSMGGRENAPELNRQHGGRIHGPSGPDKVSIMATKDEFMIRAGVSKPWMSELAEFNRTGDPSVFFKGRGFRAGGAIRMPRIGYQAGGAITDGGIDRLLAANNDVLNTISEKLDGLADISGFLAQAVEQLENLLRVPIEVNIPDSKVAFDPLQIHLSIDDVGRLATKEDLLELQPRERIEGFGNTL